MSPYPIDTPLDFNRDTPTEGIDDARDFEPSPNGLDEPFRFNTESGRGRERPFPVHQPFVINQYLRRSTMFGLNRAEVIGRLGADVTVNHLTSGGRVANMSIATDESYLDRNSGNREERTEWHRIVHLPARAGSTCSRSTPARAGCSTCPARCRRGAGARTVRNPTGSPPRSGWPPGGRVQFLDKPNGANGNGTPAAQATGLDNGSVASGGVTDPAPATQNDDDIPF